jgi:DNA processing protein
MIDKNINNKTTYLVGLHKAINLTYIRYQKLKKFFNNDFKKAFNASINDWQQAQMDLKVIEKFFAGRSKINPEKEMNMLSKCNAKVILVEDSNLFLSLKNIPNPPVLIFMRGEILETDFPSISVVGSRKISPYGKRAIDFILREILQEDITIISGLAFGTDTLAHQITLNNGGRTIAVLGNGIDEIYPKQNNSLGNKILKEKQGAIISEYLPGTPIRPENFPVRNRIVAGLSRGIILIEAAEKSGSLITASLANDMGREVFAIPGELFSKTSKGTNQLIAKGEAHIALSGRLIIETLNFNHHRISK